MPYPDIDPTGVKWRIRSYMDLWEELLAHHRVGRPLVVGIDGHSGSGKASRSN
jgi:pantothenate kinase-related protein Tda10